MAKKKTIGPKLEYGVEFRLVPANKKALIKLKESVGDKSVLMENLVSLSPIKFVGADEGADWLLKNHDKWSGVVCPYVTVRDINSIKTAKIDDLKERIHAEEKSLEETLKKADVKSFKAKLVTCKGCESKINKDYISEFRCPVCEQDFRSKTTLNTIANKEAKIQKLEERLKAEQVKHADKAPLKYLVTVPKFAPAKENRKEGGSL